jgi:hypothetical protein
MTPTRRTASTGPRNAKDDNPSGDTDGRGGELMAGRPRREWPESELAYLDEQFKVYKLSYGGAPAAETYIHVALGAWMDFIASEKAIREAEGKGINAESSASTKDLRVRREGALKRLSDAIGALGAKPADHADEMRHSADMASVHLKYREQLAKCERDGVPWGRVDKEAQVLAQDHGLDPQAFVNTGVLTARGREQMFNCTPAGAAMVEANAKPA